MELPKGLQTLMNTTMNDHLLHGWNIYQDNSGAIVYKLRFMPSDKMASHRHNAPMQTLHYKRKSPGQMNRDNQRVQKWKDSTMKPTMKRDVLTTTVTVDKQHDGCLSAEQPPGDQPSRDIDANTQKDQTPYPLDHPDETVHVTFDTKTGEDDDSSIADDDSSIADDPSIADDQSSNIPSEPYRESDVKKSESSGARSTITRSMSKTSESVDANSSVATNQKSVDLLVTNSQSKPCTKPKSGKNIPWSDDWEPPPDFCWLCFKAKCIKPDKHKVY